jgi:hypothetical protein
MSVIRVNISYDRIHQAVVTPYTSSFINNYLFRGGMTAPVEDYVRGCI